MIQKIGTILKPYLKCKQEELEKTQISLRSDHFSKMNHIFNSELMNARKAIDLSGEIIQHTYLLLSANMMLTDDMERKMSQLHKLHDGQRGVKFTAGSDKSPRSPRSPIYNDEEDEEVANSHSLEVKAFEDEMIQLSMNGMDDFDVPQHLPTRAKRALNIDDANTSEPKRFASDNLLNVTQVLDPNPNVTITVTKPSNAFKSKATIVPITRKVGLSRALRETSSNIRKDYAIPKASIKPIVNGLPQTPKEKENNRMVLMRKSPRRNSPNKSMYNCIFFSFYGPINAYNFFLL